MKQIYHNYLKWEDYSSGMWRIVAGKGKKSLMKKAIKLMEDTDLFGKWMLKVTNKWFFSCEHNLTCQNTNRRAWIGQAACCLAVGCPEEITRKAWGQLTEKQRFDANKIAEAVIEEWEVAHANRTCQQLSLFENG